MISAILPHCLYWLYIPIILLSVCPVKNKPNIIIIIIIFIIIIIIINNSLAYTEYKQQAEWSLTYAEY